MIKNIDKVNHDTLMLLPLEDPNTTDLVKQLYDSGVKLGDIEVMYGCLDDYYFGRDNYRERK